MIVPLLISAVCIETNSDKLSFVPSKKSEKLTELTQNEQLRKESDDSVVEKRETGRGNKFSREHDSRTRGTMEGRISRAGNENLARKMAKDALKSPKMQETMNKLSRGGDPKKKKLFVSVKVPAPPRGGNARLTSAEKKHGRGARTKGKKKKRKRHHRRHRKDHVGWPRRGSAKRTFNKEGKVNVSAKKSTGNEKNTKRDRTTNGSHSKNKSPVSKTDHKITAVKLDNSDYIDVTASTVPRQKNKGPVMLHESENMVERLMRTTTRDPSKKPSGDQGIEYSDYYSEDDVLQDIAANKIPITVDEEQNPNDRFTRQTLNSTPYRTESRIDRDIQPYYQDYDTRDKTFRYNDYSVNSLDDFQRYPTIERYTGSNRNPRVPMDDNGSPYYAGNYKPLDDRIENLAYAISTEDIPELSPGQDSIVFDPRDNFNLPDLNVMNEEARAVVVPQTADQFNYLSQYDKNLDVTEPRSVLQNANPVADIPQVSHKLTAIDLQNLYNFRHFGTTMQHLNNFDQNVYKQPQVGRISNLNIGHLPYNYKDYKDQSIPNLPAQDINNLPAVSIPNAMDQPLGKVLESLGINVNTESPEMNQNSLLESNVGPVYQNNGVDKTSNPSLSIQDLTSSNCVSNSSNEEISQGSKGKDDHIKLRSDHGRRQLSRKGIRNSNMFSLLEGDENASNGYITNTTVEETKEVASQLLDTIMEELAELKLGHSKSDEKEGLPCRLSGSWSTAQAGVKLDMKVVNRIITVTLSDLTAPRFHESLLNGTWNVSGHAPFKRGSPFTLIATDNTTSSMAVFVGACRVCQGIDTIAGVWSIGRSPKDCRDFQVATSVFNDIFRKTKLSSLKESQNATVSENATAKQKKRQS
ncbi:hypothetical protein WN55_10497 [Dufourea novaeangliae]|uniref:Uncharacterized protein n=1 Tax=Dufourea novaeangliae TaxID=178035 RepID=A0A154P3U4_DUFNO|nr:hypothetical protein WN55_10497 [Dufourea novaeangliae]